MAFPNSYVNGAAIRAALAGTAVDLTSDTIKVALFTDSVSGASKDAQETYGSGAWASGEVQSDGYTAGGKALTTPTLTAASGGKVIFKDNGAATIEWTGVTFNARGALVYDETASGLVLAAINFGSDQSVVSGTFTITWDATNGIFYYTY